MRALAESCEQKEKPSFDPSVCVSDPLSNGLFCRGPASPIQNFVPYGATENYVCREPEEDKRLLLWCKDL